MDESHAPKRRRVVPDADPCFDSRRPAEGPKIGKVQIPELVEELRSAPPQKPKSGPATKPVSKSKQRPPAIQPSKALKPNVLPTFILPQTEDAKSKHSATDIPPPTVKPKALPTFVLPDRKVDEKSNNSAMDIFPPTVKHNAIPTFVFPDREAEKPKSRSSAFRSLQTPDIPAILPPRPKMQPLPPLVFTPMKPDACALKSLPQPLPLPAPLESIPDKSMRTISTTEIARATDLFTESGTAELAHIFLHDQHPEVVNRQNEDPFIGNIGLSPHKSKHNKGSGRFLRNGLAQRASEISKRTHTDLALWRKEIEDKFASSSHRMVTPDLRLRIMKILDLPAGAKPSSPRKPKRSTSSTADTFSPGLAICRFTFPPSSTSSAQHRIQVNLEYISSQSMQDNDHFVVLSFPRVAPPRGRGSLTRISVRNPEDFVVGREIYAWEPWYEVSLSSGTEKQPEQESPEKPEPAPFPLLPSTFPHSPEPGRDDSRPVGGVALLLSRFVIMP